MAASGDDALVALGVVTRAQGVRGQLRVKLYNPDSQLLLELDAACLRRDGVARSITFQAPPRTHQGDVLLSIEGCDTRDQAEALRGSEICVERSVLPQLPAGEYYHRDLIGMIVREASGETVGTILRIETLPTIDVAVVETPRGLLDVPILDPYWVDVDMDARCVVVDHMAHLWALKSKD